MAEPGTAPALEARRLSKAYGALAVTRDVSLTIREGELLALIGPNGAGKSTLIGQLSGRLRPDAGTVCLGGRDVTALPLAARARAGLVQSFQVPSLFPSFTALGNVAVAVQARLRHRAFGVWRDAERAANLVGPAREVLEQVGLSHRAGVPVAALSHGERRYVEIAVSLALEPRVLLLDEPLAGLSRAEAERMVHFLRTLKGRVALLLVEHDMAAVFALADRVAVLVEGALVAAGPPDEVRASRAVRDAYLGEDDPDAEPAPTPASAAEEARV